MGAKLSAILGVALGALGIALEVLDYRNPALAKVLFIVSALLFIYAITLVWPTIRQLRFQWPVRLARSAITERVSTPSPASALPPARSLDDLLDAAKKHRTEASSLDITFASMLQRPLADSIVAVFELAGWRVSAPTVPLDSYRHQYFSGIEVSGYNKYLAETIAEAMKKSGLLHVRPVVLQPTIQRENPKWDFVQNKINITVGHVPE